jgi:membrane protein implicated in regulation of membrane protease activity
MRTPPRLLVIFGAATLVVVAAVAALATGWWWLLPVVLVTHLGVFALLLSPIGKALRQGDKPDPVTDARLEEEKGRDAGLGLQGGAERDPTHRGAAA